MKAGHPSIKKYHLPFHLVGFGSVLPSSSSLICYPPSRRFENVIAYASEVLPYTLIHYDLPSMNISVEYFIAIVFVFDKVASETSRNNNKVSYS